MHDLGGLQNPQRRQWSDEFQKKSGFFFGKSCSRIFGASDCHPSTLTLIDFANNDLVSKSSVEPKCMISEGYRNTGGVTGPMKFKKKVRFFFEKSCSRALGPVLAIQAP